MFNNNENTLSSWHTTLFQRLYNVIVIEVVVMGVEWMFSYTFCAALGLFINNQIPASTKRLYIVHLTLCGRCRKDDETTLCARWDIGIITYNSYNLLTEKKEANQYHPTPNSELG